MSLAHRGWHWLLLLSFEKTWRRKGILWALSSSGPCWGGEWLLAKWRKWCSRQQSGLKHAGTASSLLIHSINWGRLCLRRFCFPQFSLFSVCLIYTALMCLMDCCAHVRQVLKMINSIWYYLKCIWGPWWLLGNIKFKSKMSLHCVRWLIT